jgi:hypothetical protein
MHPRIRYVTVAVLALAGTLFAAVAGASGFLVYSPSNPDYPTKVDFVTSCKATVTGTFDPLVFPGRTGGSHDHTFSGNTVVTPSSTPASLALTPSTCTMSRDRAVYWMPSLYNNGVRVLPYTSRAYYRAGTTKGASIKPMPFGLKMVAGNPAATSPQASNVAGFQCRNSGGNSVPKQSLPPRCAAGDFLEASVVFPNCWDGTRLDSADHRSHMSYAVKFACDAGHPIQLPQLTFSERFPVDAARRTVTLSSDNSPLTLHADFINAWDTATMKMLTERCINRGIACEDVSDRRLPPA